ncbi:MAG: hypothetical protein K2R98_14820 [Gemmataceae bacterium]|nr:hypothetical protein [Gemmataceae bacterium]
MTGPVPLTFPGSRTLAGWWRQLASWQPQALWVGHLFLHRAEALTRRTQQLPTDPLQLLILKALSLAPAANADALEARLHLDLQLLGQALRSLQAADLARDEGGWRPTPRGTHALVHGTYPRAVDERRVFYFVESERTDRPAQYLPLKQPATVPWAAGDNWSFAPSLLTDCVRQPEDWKRRHGFPTDVDEVFDVGAELASGQPESWQRVILDRPEHLAVALVPTRDAQGDERLLGFAVRQDGWALLSDSPAFVLGDSCREVFPSVVEGISREVWEQAWQTWCQPRGLGVVSDDTGSLQVEGHRLRVTVSARLLGRLRATRSDALKGEAWVLAGTGRLRAAALLDPIEGEVRPELHPA